MKPSICILSMAGIALISSACAAQSGPEDPIARAAAGLNAAIEDDVNGTDTEMLSMSNTGCITHIVAKEREWDVDWRKAEMVSREDTFIFVKAPPVQLAIVADMGVPGQSEKLDELALAIRTVTSECLPSGKGADVKKSEILLPPEDLPINLDE